MIKKINVDYRESQGRIDYAKKLWEKEEVSIVRLDYGDFLFENEDGTQVLFEYKTGSDFLNSILNNHLFNQTVEACTNYEYQFIIVECFSLHDKINSYYYDTGIQVSLNQINGAIASLNTISTVLFAQGQGTAFDLMYRQANKIFEDKPLTWKFNKKTLNPALNYLTSIKGLQNNAHIICKKLNLNNLEDLINLTEEDLITVDGIGKKKAGLILKSIRR